MIKIDLTTLSGWDNVSSGTHEISVVAKAAGYLDSEKSTAVTFTKASDKVLLEKGTYQFIENPNCDISIMEIDENISGKMNSLTADNTYGEQTSFDGITVVDSTGQIGVVFIGNSTNGNQVQCAGGDWKYVNTDGDEYTTTDTSKLRTIVLETDQYVSQEFYDWAITQANLVKVEQSTSHTLTWSDSTMAVTVNGNAVTSPYTLANGDKIVLKRTSGYQSYNIITNTGSFDTDSTQSPLAVSNSDIKLQNGSVDMSPSVKFGFTINYTE